MHFPSNVIYELMIDYVYIFQTLLKEMFVEYQGVLINSRLQHL